MTESLVWTNHIDFLKADAVTDSLTIAEQFDKDHRHVLRDIRDLVKMLNQMKSKGVSKIGLPETSKLHDYYSRAKFKKVRYKNQQGHYYEKYEMDFTAFMLLTMGFTGEKAMYIKIMFVGLFEDMVKELTNIRTERIMGKHTRRCLTDAIQQNIKDATGSDYAKYTELAYQTVFRMSSRELKVAKNYETIRNTLNPEELKTLERVESRIANMLDMEYSYNEIKDHLNKKFAA